MDAVARHERPQIRAGVCRQARTEPTRVEKNAKEVHEDRQSYAEGRRPKAGGRVVFEWPRHCAGWALKELQALVRDLGMIIIIIDSDGCQVDLCDDAGQPFLKRWRLATTCWRTARLFSGLRCKHPKDFKHAVLEGKYTKKSGFYTNTMAYHGRVLHQCSVP